MSDKNREIFSIEKNCQDEPKAGPSSAPDNLENLENFIPSVGKSMDCSVTKGIKKMFRSSLPGIGQHFRRLMRFKKRNTLDYASVATIANHSDESDSDVSSSSFGLEMSSRPHNPDEFTDSDHPSTPSRIPESELPGESDITISTIYPPSAPRPIMVSQEVNTSPSAFRGIARTSVVNNDGTIVAGNPLELAAALHGYSGSESSSESGIMDEYDDSEILARLRRNEIRQLYDETMRQTVRKHFRHLDDEPSIYQ